MTLKTVSSWTSFGGSLSVIDHASAVTGTSMRFAVYLPPQADMAPVPAITYLSGLTCTWENVMTKAGLQRWAAELGLAIVAPDTSPRGPGVPDDERYDLGQGAGFYLTAKETPWSRHFKMDQYVIHELWDLVHAHFPLDPERHGIMGHSMGGHGAITLHLKYHEDRYKSCSAFSPITSPAQVPWGQRAFRAYLGEPNTHWEFYDATELIKRYQTDAHILIDTGEDDEFLHSQLIPDVFAGTAEAHGQAVTSRLQPGYDHSYYFVASFAEEHMRHHAAALFTQ